MMTASGNDPDPRAVLEACLAELADNKPADAVLQTLRAIEPALGGEPVVRARFLRARAIATNRLGFPEDALGDLHEARRLLEGSAHSDELAAIFQAIATVFSWRGDGREAALALLRAVAEATAGDDRVTLALALIEGGRLQMEIGRPADARALLARGIEIGGADLPRGQFQRAWVNLAQALVASGETERARGHLAAMPDALARAPARLLLLANLEAARSAPSAADATAALDRARAYLPAAADSFEAIEVAQAEAELALARQDPGKAAELLERVVSRYAADDLAAREVQARLLQARALEALGRADEAAQTLAAGLRRAIARGLDGHADAVRSRLMSAAAHGAPPPAVAMTGMETDADRRFVRQRPLGAGAFGKVMRAYDLELGIEVAIKRTTLQSVYEPAVRERMRQAAQVEMAAASRIAHPGIARVYGLLSLPGGDTLVIEELVEGPTLRHAMQDSFAPARSFELLSRIAFSLAAVHGAGVVHRDLKPENIILRGGDAPVLIDFGIALLKGGSAERGTGTPAYMAPEQRRGGKTDARADLYALGIIAFELLTGSRPADRRDVRGQLAEKGIEPETAHLVGRLLSHRIWRPRSASEVGSAFAEAGAR